MNWRFDGGPPCGVRRYAPGAGKRQTPQGAAGSSAIRSRRHPLARVPEAPDSKDATQTPVRLALVEHLDLYLRDERGGLQRVARTAPGELDMGGVHEGAILGRVECKPAVRTV